MQHFIAHFICHLGELTEQFMQMCRTVFSSQCKENISRRNNFLQRKNLPTFQELFSNSVNFVVISGINYYQFNVSDA